MEEKNMNTEGKPLGTVLVVDDDENNRMLLRDVLVARGYRIKEADNGRSALDIISEEPPDTVLLDVMMKDMDGFEVCRTIKNNPDTACIPVLLVTGLAGRKDRLTGMEAGADDFITKPVDTREVALRTRNAVRRKQLQDQVEVAYTELQKLVDLRQNLARWLVHDMKAPLSGILGHLELMQMRLEGGGDDTLREYADEAYSATEHLHEMINSILDVSRLENQQMPLNLDMVNLRPVVQKVCEELQHGIREQKITVEMPSDSMVAFCDGDIMRRVILNLVGNAVKYIQDGGHIRIVFEPGAADIRVRIIDNGSGIPPPYHEKIFEMFGQVEIRQERKVFSSGMGLTFCKLAVEAHGGKMGVISEDSQGSEFWFTLPASPPVTEKGQGE